jgi:hypothetical protein
MTFGLTGVGEDCVVVEEKFGVVGLHHRTAHLACGIDKIENFCSNWRNRQAALQSERESRSKYIRVMWEDIHVSIRFPGGAHFSCCMQLQEKWKP